MMCCINNFDNGQVSRNIYDCTEDRTHDSFGATSNSANVALATLVFHASPYTDDNPTVWALFLIKKI